MHARILCASPLVAVIDDFATEAECVALARWLDDPAWTAEQEPGDPLDTGSQSGELAAAADPLARALATRIEAAADPIESPQPKSSWAITTAPVGAPPELKT